MPSIHLIAYLSAVKIIFSCLIGYILFFVAYMVTLVKFTEFHYLCYASYWRVMKRFITVTKIFKQQDINLKRIMVEAYGLERFIADIDLKPAQIDETGTFYKFFLSGRLEPYSVVKVRNSTAEKDGSFKDYYLRVPPHIQTAREGIAWSFGLDANKYAPTIET